MKNDYEVRGPVTAIMCEASPKAGGGLVEVIISTLKLEMVKAWPRSWITYVDESGQILLKGSSIRRTVPGFASQQPYLHRVVAKTPLGYRTIFKDGNTLNCTDENLVNVRIGQAYNHTPVQPVRGVHWRQDKNKYETAAFYKGRRFNLGLFDKDKLAEANRAVEEFRRLGPTEYFKKYPKKG